VRVPEREPSQFSQGLAAQEADARCWLEIFRRDGESAISVADPLFVYVGPITVGDNLSATRAARRLDVYHDAIAGSFQIDRPSANLVSGESVDETDKSHAPSARSEMVPN
jgi:hypothetical protein